MYTPDNITELQPNEVMTFGSNKQGIHRKGAAKTALEKFGANYGQGEGLQGNSYAIPTRTFVGKYLQTLPLSKIEPAIKRYLEFAARYPELTFYTTAIGTGLAGHKTEDIVALFSKHTIPDNVILPKEFAVLISGADEKTQDEP